MNRKLAVMLLLILVTVNTKAQIKILFDATKAETAGNADWIIDATTHNLYWGPYAQLSGTESNAQRIPVPAQSGITAATLETYWDGGLSNWGIDCVKQGYVVESLPYNVAITYGSTTNVQDLSQYAVYIVCEPNLPFSAAEKTAIWNYVQAGGSLFIISDHDQSDRNGDGTDSPVIWNSLLTGETTGLTINIDNFSGTSTLIANTGSDSITNGQYGSVTQVLWSSGTDITVNTTVNSTARAAIYRSGNNNNNSNVLFAYAHYGSGKIAVIGDSSPCDDGSGDPNDALYNGYIIDAGGNHRKLLMNATIWLAKNSINQVSEGSLNSNQVYSYDKTLVTHLSGSSPIVIRDLSGKIAKSVTNQSDNSEISLDDLSVGIYIVSYEGRSKLIAIQ